MLFLAKSALMPKRPVPYYRVWGYKSAPIKVEVFSDLQCPACAVAHGKLDELKQKHGDKLTVTFKHFPLPGHKWSFKAAVFAECAGEQDMFNECVEELFRHQKQWYGLTDAPAYFIHVGENMHLNMPKLYKCLSSQTPAIKVRADLEEAVKRKIKGTPYFFINRSNPMTFEQFRKKFFKKVKKYETTDLRMNNMLDRGNPSSQPLRRAQGRLSPAKGEGEMQDRK
jgi:protein-disulfide isomerase